MDTKQLLEQIKNIVRSEIQAEAEITRQKTTSEKFDMLNRLVGIEERLKDVETSNHGIEEKQVDLAVAQKKQEQNINARLDTQSQQLEAQGKQLITQGQQLDNGNTQLKRTNTRLDTLEKGQAQLHTAIAQNTTILETLEEAQKSSTDAIRADIQDLASKMAKNKKEIDIRLDSLDEHTSHHNPIKH